MATVVEPMVHNASVPLVQSRLVARRGSDLSALANAAATLRLRCDASRSPERETSLKFAKLQPSCSPISELPWARGETPRPPSSMGTTPRPPSAMSMANRAAAAPTPTPPTPTGSPPPPAVDLSMVKPPMGPPPVAVGAATSAEASSTRSTSRQSTSSTDVDTDTDMTPSPTAVSTQRRDPMVRGGGSGSPSPTNAAFPLSSLLMSPNSSPSQTKHSDPMSTSLIRAALPMSQEQATATGASGGTGPLGGLSSLADVCQEASLSRRSSIQGGGGGSRHHSPTSASGSVSPGSDGQPPLRSFSWSQHSPSSATSSSSSSSMSSSASLVASSMSMDATSAAAAKEFASRTVLVAQNRSKNWPHIILNTFAQKAASLNVQISEVSLSGDDINKHIDLNWASVSTGFRRSRTWKSTVRATLHRSDLFRHTKYGWSVHDGDEPPPLADRSAERSKDRDLFPLPLHNGKHSASLRSQSRVLRSSRAAKPPSSLPPSGSSLPPSGRASPRDSDGRGSLANHRSTQSIEYWKSYAQKIHTRLQGRKRRRGSACSTGSTLSNPGVSVADMRPDEFLVTRHRSVSHQVPLPVPSSLGGRGRRGSGSGTELGQRPSKMRRNSQSVARGTLASQLDSLASQHLGTLSALLEGRPKIARRNSQSVARGVLSAQLEGRPS